MAWPTTSRHERGYGIDHNRIRKQLLAEEPLCRTCAAKDIYRTATIADHIVPKSKGGLNVRSNYQPLCQACSDEKTAREAGRSPSPRSIIGLDGWPIDPKGLDRA